MYSRVHFLYLAIMYSVKRINCNSN